MQGRAGHLTTCEVPHAPGVRVHGVGVQVLSVVLSHVSASTLVPSAAVTAVGYSASGLAVCLAY